MESDAPGSPIQQIRIKSMTLIQKHTLHDDIAAATQSQVRQKIDERSLAPTGTTKKQ